MSRPTVDQASKQNIGDSEFGIRKFGCFDDVSKILRIKLLITNYDFILLDTNVITEGETSDEFYFYTLLSSPPSSLECETLYNQMDLTWNNPTNGLDSGTSYEYSYSVTESMFIIYLNSKVIQNKLNNTLRRKIGHMCYKQNLINSLLCFP